MPRPPSLDVEYFTEFWNHPPMNTIHTTRSARRHVPLRRLSAHLFAALSLAVLASCGGGGDKAGDQVVLSSPSGQQLKVVTVTGGLVHPWAVAFLPDGRALVTEREGSMRYISDDGLTTSEPIKGIPAVQTGDQAGLLDVQLDPDYATSPWVYWTYSEPGTGADEGKSGTAVARGKLVNDTMTDVQVIFRQTPKVTGLGHYGSRLVFAKDKTLFVTLGERQKDDPANPGVENAQNLTKHLGKVVRIQRDGSLPGDNPHWDVAGALPEIWSMGHRNPQGAALHPVTGELWVNEHGPQGGDEVNRVLPGHNYGWPLRSYGCPYGSPVGEACRVANGAPHAPDFDEPITFWVPTSIAPSGMAFYTANKHPDWQGNLFVGSLAGQALWRLTLVNNTVTAREALFTNALGRIRDVRQGPDGWIYLLTEHTSDGVGQLRRVER